MNAKEGIKIISVRPHGNKEKTVQPFPLIPNVPPVHFTIKRENNLLTQVINKQSNDSYFMPDYDKRSFRGRLDNQGKGFGSLLHLVHNQTEDDMEAIHKQVQNYIVQTHTQCGNILNIIDQHYLTYLNTQKSPNVVLVTVDGRDSATDLQTFLQNTLTTFNKIIWQQCLMIVSVNNHFFMFVRNNLSRHVIIDTQVNFDELMDAKQLNGYQRKYVFKVNRGIAVLHFVMLILRNNCIDINYISNLNTDCYGKDLVRYYEAMIEGNVNLKRIDNIRESNKFSRS